MRFKTRKFRIWIIALGVVLGVYLLYNRIRKTPCNFVIDNDTKTINTTDKPSRGIGMIGDVGIERAEKARFTDLNKDTKKLEREWGFERLLYEIRNEWEIEKPYMNTFRDDLKCYITADKGSVLLEPDMKRPSPKNATFTGNVVIHILPQADSNGKESFVYLDDITFVSEKSMFSTSGPVKFISQDAQLLGRGLELVYNDRTDRLEFLKIVHLESLHLKTSQTALFSRTTQAAAPAKQPDRRPTQTAQLSSGQTDVEPANRSAIYRCVLSKNVVMDCPQQLIFADELIINNIASETESGKADTTGADGAEVSQDIIEKAPTSQSKEVNESSARFGDDIVVTCDGGITVTPMGTPAANSDLAKLSGEPTVTGGRGLENYGDTGGRASFAARRINYCALTDEIILEGDCLCTMSQPESNFQKEYRLSAPKITVNLYSDKDKRPSALAPEIKHLTAEGGLVELSAAKRAHEELLGFVKLKCLKFDYDTGQREMFSATGPGVIAVDNSGIAEPDTPVGRFSLKKPCIAVVRDFETLEFLVETNQIIAENKLQRILIDYFPVIAGQYGQQVSATAARIEAFLHETAGGKTELSTLNATGGVSYDEKDIEFEGGEFFYDDAKATITAWSDGSRPCLLNGALVEGIKYNLKTGRAAEAKIVAPGTLQIK